MLPVYSANSMQGNQPWRGALSDGQYDERNERILPATHRREAEIH
jgi:hypothetical protein